MISVIHILIEYASRADQGFQSELQTFKKTRGGLYGHPLFDYFQRTFNSYRRLQLLLVRPQACTQGWVRLFSGWILP